jgi:hypothetical protein
MTIPTEIENAKTAFPETVGITASKRKLLRIFIKMQYKTLNLPTP